MKKIILFIAICVTAISCTKKKHCWKIRDANAIEVTTLCNLTSQEMADSFKNINCIMCTYEMVP